MRRALPIIVTGMLVGAVAQAGATASGGGGVAITGSGGASASLAATIRNVSCASGCAGLALARPGATVAVTGTGFDSVASVVFLGGHDPADDVTVPVEAGNATEADAVVPAGAVSGRVSVVNADGTMSAPSAHALRITSAPIPSGGAVHTALSAKNVYYDGTDPATLRYFVDSAGGSFVTVALVHGSNGKRVASWGPSLVDSGAVGSVTWNGASGASSSGVAAEGRYTFKVMVSSVGGGVRAASTEPDAVSTFMFLPDVFPVAGKHHFNLGAGRFGAQRAGHTHQGQDIMANCGVPIVAARGGTIEKVAVDVNAGNYVVIDPAGTGVDMFYAHLREPSPLAEGSAVLSGQQIGVVGRTGDATACHLHFEEWTAPGWYKGGHPFDPLPDLRQWERESRAARGAT
jgi:murein DD-endopeptidase MepM/ murein hydrolase activator NlpD